MILHTLFSISAIKREYDAVFLLKKSFNNHSTLIVISLYYELQSVKGKLMFCVIHDKRRYQLDDKGTIN
jgi:hypothetical protein